MMKNNLRMVAAGFWVLTASFLGAAESTGTRSMTDLPSEATFFWDTTSRVAPSVAYARVALTEQQGVAISVSAVMATDDFLQGGDFDALVYYPYVISSPFLMSTFPMGMRIIVR